MTFKKEISIDGVAAIIGIITAVGFFFNLSFDQKATAKTVDDHELRIRQMHEVESSLAQSLAVLTAIQNKTSDVMGNRYSTPRQKDNQ